MKFCIRAIKVKHLFFLFILFLRPEALVAQTLVINLVSPSNVMIKKYGLFELNINLTAAYNNPYDYNDISLTCIFTSPTGKKDTADGFFMQNYILDTLNGSIKKSGSGVFKIRFSPNKTGTWKYYLLCKNKSGITATTVKTFACSESSNPGFIQTNPSNYLSFNNNRQYIPIGENMNTYDTNFFIDYKKWIDKLSANGGNFISAWMINKGAGIEWKVGNSDFGGLKNYNQTNAFQLDWLLDYCAKKNIYVMICLNTAGNAASTINPAWYYNPYNKINGGPSVNQGDFFSDSLAKSILKNRLRYILARYGYSPNIMAWELFNEVDGIEQYINYKTDVTAWIDEMSAFIKSKDLNKHLVTVSYSNENNDEVTWRLSNIDFTQTHQYLGMANIEKAIAHISDEYINKYNKPELTGEFGINATNIDLAKIDPDGVYIHNVIWASAFSGAMGTAMTYWWHNYIDPQHLYYHFKALSAFISMLKLKDEQYSKATGTYIVNAGLTDIVFTPNAGWGAITADTFKIDEAGNIKPNANQSGIYLFGNVLNTQFHKPAIFSVNYFADGNFSVFTGATATPSSKIDIWVDGKKMMDKEGKINTVYTIPVSAGKHIIKVENTGKDWIWINQYLFTNTVSLLDGYTLKNALSTKAAGYIHNSNYNWKYLSTHAQNLPPAIAKGSAVKIPGLQNGNYTIRFYDCISGKIFNLINALSNNGSLTFKLPAIQWDLAFTAERVN